ncbi:TetR/AcrR family transcriptional regulator [Chelativorans salis]|uniref:TetR/AcrR family transcriptional regulator n=1 Tax=Chelativorans salis TaxID=2978478 RepID=A0ABT2LPT4_9HYPH|nr:TetR/AcrR family transcriptional regulator [Chelativorans sp. EGI FJ00035]MCT7376570.1 TetR/AcrR family transcriptional regulator [Chelativorans sp. EGI FJ00035]
MVVSTPKTIENSKADDPRRARILEAAMQVFLAYGFSRTTMDDIARAVEISRPALYLLFRNKADIFRAVAEAMLERSRAGACELLFEEGPLEARLMAALDRALFQLFRIIEDSPHGDELVDVNHNIASDVVASWRQGMVACFARAIGEEAQRRGVRLEERGLSAESLAEMLFDVLEGLKARGLCRTHGEEAARRFVTLIEMALKEK